MPAPETLTTQTPGDTAPVVAPPPPDSPASPEFIAKHNGAGRWKVWKTEADGGADWFSDFVGTKDAAIAEAQRLTDGGEPLVLDPERHQDRAALAQAKPSGKAVNATALKQPVMTPDGWLCPEPPVKE